MKMMLLQLQCIVLVSCEKGHNGFFVLSLLVDYDTSSILKRRVRIYNYFKI